MENGLSRNLYKEYINKLPNCVRIIHKGIDPAKEGIQEGKKKGIYPLIDKWINICKDSSSNSKIYVLHAADDYSTERRLITHYNHFKNDKCIFSSMPTGIFYNILTKQTILYDYRDSNELYVNTHLNMAYRKKDIELYVNNKTPNFNKFIDKHIKSCVLKGLNIKVLTSETHLLDLDNDNWKTGFFTDGYNNISINRKKIYNRVYSKGFYGGSRNNKYVISWFGNKKLKKYNYKNLQFYIPEEIINKLNNLSKYKVENFIDFEGFDKDNKNINYDLVYNIIIAIIILSFFYIQKRKRLIWLLFITITLRLIYNRKIKNQNIQEPFTNSKYHFYGGKYIDILKNMGYKIIIGDGTLDKNKMSDIYKKCYVCLRLVNHDGISYGVQEAGLMGIKTIHNGDSPAALNYSDFQSIVNLIENEKKNCGKINIKLHYEVKKYLDFDTDTFLNLNRFFNTNSKQKIRQIYSSKSMNFFIANIKKRFKDLQDYTDEYKPAIFFGIYNQGDVDTLKNHKSYGLIIWGGTDSTRKHILEQITDLDKERFIHIAQSNWIKEDLKIFNIESTRINFQCVDIEKYKPVKKGKYIYAYCPSCGI